MLATVPRRSGARAASSLSVSSACQSSVSATLSTVPTRSPAILTSPPLTIWLALVKRACTTYGCSPLNSTTASAATPMTSAAIATARPAPLTICRPLPWSARHGTLMFQVRQTPTLFAQRSPVAQLVGALVIPALFGAVCGVVLGSSATAYWALQAAGAIGGVLG